MPTLEGLVGLLLERYGPQGWWPLLEPVGPEREWRCVYRPGDYRLPAEPLQRFEIGVGAILTQNTGWPGVIRALINLRRADRLAPDALLDETAAAEIRQLIRPSGYFNQKQLRLRTWAGFFNELNGRAPQRSQLLVLNGIGPETADSILVYAYGQAQFIADAYARRIVERCLGGIWSYDGLARAMQAAFRWQEEPERLRTLGEAHALLVEHGKRFCRKRPLCRECFLHDGCLSAAE